MENQIKYQCTENGNQIWLNIEDDGTIDELEIVCEFDKSRTIIGMKDLEAALGLANYQKSKVLKPKIFEIEHQEGKDWVYASTEIEALNCYLNTTEGVLSDIVTSEIRELPASLWSNYFVVIDDEDTAISFASWVESSKCPEYISGIPN